MSRRAAALCRHAAAIQGCDGFAAACARANPEPPASSHALVQLPGWLGALTKGIVWLLVAALFLAILVPIARGLGRLRREGAPEPDDDAEPAQPDAVPPPPPITDEEALLARADELARSGEGAAALELYLAASLRALDKRGAVRIARDRTNGEYVRACSDGEARAALRGIVGEVDRVQFGGERAAPEALARAGRCAATIVRSASAALVVLALALAGSGCGHTPQLAPRKGDDPAGLDVFQRVLQRQGVGIEPLGRSLASLPLPQPEELTPAVIVDVARTPLDQETSTHLVEWVAAGGVLVLAGSPLDWPRDFHAAPASADGEARVTARALLARADDDDDASEPGGPVYARETEHAELAANDAVVFEHAVDRPAAFQDGALYAAVLPYGQGRVLAIATDELLTNVGLTRPGNAAAMVAILSNADRLPFQLAQADDGVAPPSTPLTALLRAGLGLAMAHALLASALLFLASGVRLTRPRPAPPPSRRAFAEHVEAVGALYARTGNARHALAAYVRFADERLRAHMPGGAGDVAAFLASRARMPLEHCRQLWSRATASRTGEASGSDDLAVLEQLVAAYAAAMMQER
jgi:hypothetical protein